jgi:hypothetical protein
LVEKPTVNPDRARRQLLKEGQYKTAPQLTADHAASMP